MRCSIAVTLLLLAGCSLSTESPLSEPAPRLVLAAIAGYFAEDPVVEVASSGRTAHVRVRTYGSSCNALGTTDVRVEGLTATVTPYNHAPPPGSPCPRDLRIFVHEATVDFASTGSARILVRGLDARTRSATNLVGDTLTVERVVELR